jgi:nucleoside-diphosphate-sugar epimerase
MNIVITGGAGFLGQRLARALLAAPLGGRSVERLVLADRVEGPDLNDRRATYAVGDIADASFVSRIVTSDVETVFHLAAVVSGEAEANFDLGMTVNIDASRLLLDACRRLESRPQVVFTSSVAVFGPLAPDASIDDSTSVDPRSSYGMEKAVAELLLKDYSRRGFVDGIVLRLPTISVRPGVPNKAASSFASGIIREPLSGVPTICPVPHTTALWLLSPRRAIEALVTAVTLDTGQLGLQRVINLPGISVTVGEMLSALEATGGAKARRLVSDEIDPAVERIVASWPKAWDDSRAKRLGFRGDFDFGSIVDAFVEDDLPQQKTGLKHQVL